MPSIRILLLVTFLSSVTAFAPSTTSTHHRRTLTSSPLFAKEGGAIASPKTIVTTTTTTKQKSKQKVTQKQSVKLQEDEPETEYEEAPLWMLFLIGDKSYQQAHVTNRLTQIVEDVTEKNAIAIYEAAQRVGEALCGKYQHEHAELFCEQLTRSDPIIYAEIREDKKDD